MNKDQKKQCFFKERGIVHIDFRDTELLKKFLDPHARIISRKRTSVSAKYQRKLSQAIKRARIMALLPFVKD